MALTADSFKKLKVYLVVKKFLDEADLVLESWTGKLKYAYHWAAHEVDRRLPHPQVAAAQDIPEPNHESGIPEQIRTAAGIVIPGQEAAAPITAETPAPTVVADAVVKTEAQVITAAVEPAAETVVQKVEEKVEAVVEDVKSAVEHVVEEVKEGVAHLEGEVEKKADEVKEEAAPSLTDAEKGAAQLDAELQQGVQHAEGEVEKKVDEAVGTVEQKAAE